MTNRTRDRQTVSVALKCTVSVVHNPLCEVYDFTFVRRQVNEKRVIIAYSTGTVTRMPIFATEALACLATPLLSASNL